MQPKPTPLLLDSYEPVQLQDALRQAVEVIRYPLNSRGYGDIMWTANHTITLERKAVGDLIGSMQRSTVGEKRSAIERRLALCLEHTEETGLIVEGILTPLPKGCMEWRASKDGRFFFPCMQHGMGYSAIMAFLYRVGKMGVTVYYTPTLEATAQAIVAFYRNSHKTKHKVLGGGS